MTDFPLHKDMCTPQSRSIAVLEATDMGRGVCDQGFPLPSFEVLSCPLRAVGPPLAVILPRVPLSRFLATCFLLVGS